MSTPNICERQSVFRVSFCGFPLIFSLAFFRSMGVLWGEGKLLTLYPKQWRLEVLYLAWCSLCLCESFYFSHEGTKDTKGSAISTEDGHLPQVERLLILLRLQNRHH